MISTERIGRNIRCIRERKGMTLTELADKVGVAKSTIHRLENGICEHTSLTTFINIAETLKVSLDELTKKHETKTFKVPVVYSSFGFVEIEALDKEDLLNNLRKKAFIDKIKLPKESSYVDDSLEIDFDLLEEHLGE